MAKGSLIHDPLRLAVTCPLLRQHPVIVAQAAATSALLTGGGFTLGVGTGEALNEHILGSRWPGAEERMEMLEEAGGGDRPVQGGLKVCWGQDAGQARKTMHRLWPTDAIPGEAVQLLPLPRHFGQVYVGQVGGEAEGFFEFYARQVLPRLRDGAA